MGLVDRHIFCRSVNFTGRGYNQTAHPAVAGGLTHIERSLDISVDIAVRRYIAVGNRNQCGEMIDCVTAFGNMAAEIRVSDIACDYFKIRAAYFFKPAQLLNELYWLSV